jgi:glutamate dehydrogenase/leucine dehydrogenase
MIHVVESVKADISKMSNEQLNEVADSINMRRQRLTKQAIRSVIPGDIVSFETRNGPVTGKVRKVNRKTVTVGESNSINSWKVPANLLTKLAIGG